MPRRHDISLKIMFTENHKKVRVICLSIFESNRDNASGAYAGSNHVSVHRTLGSTQINRCFTDRLTGYPTLYRPSYTLLLALQSVISRPP